MRERHNPGYDGAVEIRHLETFLAVARDASFTRAAESLHLTQPAVTRQIAALEAELRTRLFDRPGKTIRLTAAGETLRAYAEQTLRLERSARAAVAQIAQGVRGHVTVGAASTLATYVLPPLLARFRRERPGLELTLRTGLSARVREQVRDAQVDVGVVTTEGVPEPEEHALAVRRLGAYETVLVTPPGHPLGSGGPRSVAALDGEALLAMEVGTNLRGFVDRALALCGATPRIAMELDSVETIKRMVEAGLGVSLLPRVSVRDEAAAGRLSVAPLTDLPRPDREIVVLWRTDRTVSAAQQAFLDLLPPGGTP